MKRIIYGLLAIFGLLISLALIIPFFIDVNQYKGDISLKVKEATGRDLIIEGPIQLSLFPLPALTLRQVKLTNHPQAQASHLVSFEKASVKAAILPLFQKKIHITKVSLKEAKIELEKLPNGTMNWEFLPQKTSAIEESVPAPPKSSSDASPPSFDVGIDKISIEDAQITYREGSQTTMIKDLSLEASLHSLTGPYTAKGELKLHQHALKFDLKAGSLAESLPLEAEFFLADTQMKVVGTYTLASQTFKGNIESHLDVKAFQEMTGQRDFPKVMKDKIYLKALLSANPTHVSIEDVKLKLDETVVTGTVMATLGDVVHIESHLKNLPGQGTFDITVIQKATQTQGHLKANVQRLQEFLTWFGLDTQSFPSHLLGKCSVASRYTFSQETVLFRELALNLQGAQLQGDVEYRLNQKTPFARIDLRTPKVENFMPHPETKTQNALGAGRLYGILQGNVQNIVFDVQTVLGPLALALKGHAQNLDKKPTLTVDLNGQTSHLGAFLVNLGVVSQSTYRNASLTGHIAGDLENLRLNTQTTLEGLAICSSGTLKTLMTSPVFDLKLNVSHPNIRTFLKLPSHPPAEAHGATSITAHLKGNPSQFTLRDIKALIGQDFDITGKIDIHRQNEKTKVGGILTATSLNLDLLLAMAEGKQPSFREPQLMLVALKAPPVPHAWSKEPLSFAFLKNLEVNVPIMIQKLKRKDITITHLKVSPKVENGSFDAPLSGTFYGGKLQGNLRATADNTFALSIDLQDANLASLTPHYTGQIKLIGGKFSFHSALSTHGKSLDELVANLTGPLKMNARDGVINGFDLQAISQRLKQINNLQGLLGLLSNFMAKGQTTFQRFEGDILFKNGIGTIQFMQLIANGGNGQATGTINLPGYLLNIATEFQLTDHPQLPPFKMYLTGPLDNPQRNLETQALQNYLLQNVFKGVVDQLSKGKGNIGDVLGSILGQDQETQPSSSAPEKAPQKPEKVVKDLLKNLF